MNRKRWNQVVLGGVLGAGLMDAATGTALMLAPGWTLRGLALPMPAGAEVWVRWVGCFVAGVGVSYLWALAGGWERRRAMLELTALVRGGVGIFVSVAIARGWLEPGGWPVAATDLTLAAAQVALLVKGGWGERD